ncbi:hypothetical protein QBC43DRAFT_338634 [Cladorrhinum sp. PSN259]|nr:hypothetical protein QBC43DRAFT_338634 [Cladorrhinum sp. PSN259]
MHRKTLVLAGVATLAAAQDTSTVTVTGTENGFVSPLPTSYILPRPSRGPAEPCISAYSSFFNHPELAIPSPLGDWLAESTKKYFETRATTATVSMPNYENPSEEDIDEFCSERLGERTLTDLPDDVATVYSSFTSQWSSFVATAKTEASSIASVCVDLGRKFEATHLMTAVATAQSECVSAWRVAYPATTTSGTVSGGGPPATNSAPGLTTSVTTSTTSSSNGSGAGANTSSTGTTASTGGATKETGFAVAAVVAVAGVVGLL